MTKSEPMKPKLTVVITAEGLAAAALSCYGCSWNPTPELDEIASRGCVWDRFMAASTNPHDVLANWIGSRDDDWRKAVGIRGGVELFTDDPRVAEQGFAAHLDHVELLGERAFRVRTRPYERIEQTRMGQLIAAAIARVDQSDPPRVLWIHTSSLVSTWDAPRFLAVVDEAEEDDDAPSEDVDLIESAEDLEPRPEKPAAVFNMTTPASLRLADDAHPDLAMSWMRTYGCQVRLFDRLVGLVRDFEPLAGATFVVAGTHGFALGENGWIGTNAGPIRSSQLRLPLIITKPASLRIPHLVSSEELPGYLARLVRGEPVVRVDEWVQSQSEFEPRIATSDENGGRLTHTPRWFLVEESDAPPQLFLKPDDLCDVNDVARLRDDIVEHLQAVHSLSPSAPASPQQNQGGG